MRPDRKSFTLLSRSFCVRKRVVIVATRHIESRRTIWETAETEVSW